MLRLALGFFVLLGVPAWADMYPDASNAKLPDARANLAIAPHVATNAALAAVSTAIYPSGVWRDDFAAGNGAPPLWYLPSGSVCSLNAGNGDNGSQVKSSDGKCWLAVFPPVVDIREWGFTASSRAGNHTALQNIFALTTAPLPVFIPKGMWPINCPASISDVPYNAASPVKLVGEDENETILQLPLNCATFGGNAEFNWNGAAASGAYIKNLTLDLNTPGTPSSLMTAVSMQAFSGDGVSPTIDRVHVVNAVAPVFGIGLGAKTGHTLFNPTVTNSTTVLVAASAHQNQCVGMTTASAAGRITGFYIANNYCPNSGIQIDGDNGSVVNNDTFGFKFGTGIFATYNAGAAPVSDYNNYFAGNKAHDTGSTVDDNNIPPGGYESNCVGCVWEGNLAWNLGGPGFVNFGNNTTYVGNRAWDNGIAGTMGGLGTETPTGFMVAQQAGTTNYISQNVQLTGNTAFTGTGSQKFGYNELTGFVQTATLEANRFTGATRAYKIQSPLTIAGPVPVATSTNTAAAVAAITFGSLDTLSYVSWDLRCRDLISSGGVQIGIQISQDGGTTWMTTGNYGWNETDTSTAAVVNYNGTTATMLPLGAGGWDNFGNAPGAFAAALGDISVSSGAKMFRVSGGYLKPGAALSNFTGAGYWQGDHNAINALRVIAASGNISGACYLNAIPGVH